ncbi:unnamed protein product [Callosobruchus maculatus]|uniref:Uncharacterized protein n=1 Tax=Callosobruchus maculatus TaxID=64391 RepID=A0A653DMU0_CALMS|nr:unnamed protein product [Callosobruchus maculatus]
MKPADVTKKDEKRLLSTVHNRMKIVDLKTKFKVSDHVRISKMRGIFDKNSNQIGQQHITDLYDEGCPNLVTLKKTFKYRHCFKHLYNNLTCALEKRTFTI